MTSSAIDRDGVRLHAAASGPGDGPPILLLGALGTTLDLWDPLLPHLPEGLRLVRCDMRGHGRSDVPNPPYSLGAMVSDAEAVCEAFEVKDAVVLGLSVGGLIAQALAVKRLDLVRGLVLSNTAAKLGTREIWEARAQTVLERGLDPLIPDILTRWFGRDAPDALTAPYRAMLESCDPRGYAGVCAAIGGTDLMTPTSGLRLPVLGLAGDRDGSVPPDLVRETVDLIPGSEFALIRRAGHLPFVEEPEAYAARITDFLGRIGHLPGS